VSTTVFNAVIGVLSLALVGIGLYLAHNLRRQLQLKMVDRRADAYSRLWEILKVSGPWRREIGRDPMSPEERRDLYGKMTDWYFGKGNGMLLPSVTRELYLNAKYNLICDEKDLRLILQPNDKSRTLFEQEREKAEWRGLLSMNQLSLLRAQMRTDLQVFGKVYSELDDLDRAFLRTVPRLDLNKKPWKSSGGPISREF
jgi:hypothetical protein